MREFKVGERIILEVIETTCIACEDCFFAKEEYACPDNCSSTERSDGKNVIFKEVKKQRMSYESRSRCKARQITHCGICPLMFKCPYDEDKDKYNHFKK